MKTLLLQAAHMDNDFTSISIEDGIIALLVICFVVILLRNTK